MIIAISLTIVGVGIGLCFFLPLYVGVGICCLGVCILLSYLFYEVFDWLPGIAISWGVILLGYAIYLLIAVASVTTKIIVCSVIIGILILAFLVSILIVRNIILPYKLEVEKSKSDVRIAKHKYLTAIENIDRRNGKLGVGNNNGLGGIGVLTDYQTNSSTVMQLATNYANSLEKLNNKITEYNNLISGFPIIIYAKILRYKKDKLVDAECAEFATDLGDFDEHRVEQSVK